MSLFDKVWQSVSTGEAFEAITDLIPQPGSSEYKALVEAILEPTANFVRRIVDLTESARVPEEEEFWRQVAAKSFAAESHPRVSELTRLFRGELRALGMPFGLPLEELAETVLELALRLRYSRTGRQKTTS